MFYDCHHDQLIKIMSMIRTRQNSTNGVLRIMTMPMDISLESCSLMLWIIKVGRISLVERESIDEASLTIE